MAYSFNTSALAALAPLQVKLQTAGFEVLANGTVITANSTNLEFFIDNIKLVFAFQTDPGGTRLEQGPVLNNELTLFLYNFNNPMGSGTTAPLEIGSIRGKRLWVSFAVYSMSPDSPKTVHYTFLLGDGKS
ncbi:DUF6864 domain-containing function [Zoogloea sp.]|uniref:DUF6864 domain-containing function n=1 Tax=Zoogloea sp. TaxID=49181 RepID=UPI001415EA11|nr:MAG: hypothetical protein F9K15_17310 [Zoogloea sp.]